MKGGGTSYTFVTGGLAEAVGQARAAAGDRAGSATAPAAEAADNAAALRPVAGLATTASARGPRHSAIVTGGTGSPAIERSSADLGVTVAVSGTTCALRMIARTASAWAGVWRVMTVPAVPARAVRPDLCR